MVTAADFQSCDGCGNVARVLAGPFLCASCINAGASRLRKIKARYGRIIMHRVARGMSVRDALRMGRTHVARRVEHETTLSMAHVVGNGHGTSLVDVVNASITKPPPLFGPPRDKK